MSAFQQIADTFELLEQILLDISISRKQLIRFQRISKQFAAVITKSHLLQHRLFMRHDPDRHNDRKQNPLLYDTTTRLANGFIISDTKETSQASSLTDPMSLVWRIRMFSPWGIDIEKTHPMNQRHIVMPSTASVLKMGYLPHDGVLQVKYTLKLGHPSRFNNYLMIFVPAHRTIGEILEFLDAWTMGKADAKAFGGQIGRRYVRALEEDGRKEK